MCGAALSDLLFLKLRIHQYAECSRNELNTLQHISMNQISVSISNSCPLRSCTVYIKVLHTAHGHKIGNRILDNTCRQSGQQLGCETSSSFLWKSDLLNFLFCPLKSSHLSMFRFLAPDTGLDFNLLSQEFTWGEDHPGQDEDRAGHQAGQAG